MKKLTRTPAPWLYPLPAVLVSCQHEGPANIITLAWTGVVCSDPAMVGIAIRPQRYSHGIIKESGEFVVNIPTASQVEWVDLCGGLSGREVDKFARCGFTPVPGQLVKAPLIAECPVNLECKVSQILPLGSHDLFLGEILTVHHAEEYTVDQRFALPQAEPLVYGLGGYYRLGEELGRQGDWIRKAR